MAVLPARAAAVGALWITDVNAARPVVSIIVPVLNEEGQIAECLLRLRETLAESQLIVVDGGSSDNTVAIAEQLADRVIHAPRGRACQMNAGAEVATADYLLFVHADTRLPENFSNLVELWLIDRPGWGFFPVRLSGSHWLLRCVETGMNLRSRLSAIATGDQCLFVRRDLFVRVGGFPSQPLMEDVELCKRLKRIATPVTLSCRVVTSSRRWEQNGILKTIVQMWGLRLAYFVGVPAQRLARIYYPGYATKYRYPDACIVQFAKTPELGMVKTRLRGVLGDRGCLALHKALVEHQFCRQRSSLLAPLELWVSSRQGLSFAKQLIGSGEQRLAVQAGGDLGARMSNCFEDRLECYRYVILIGSDCPSMDAAYVERAILALRAGADAVIGPASDGGYVLIGLRRMDTRLFEGVPWGTNQVLEVTRNKLDRMGWQLGMLTTLSDIDRPGDLASIPTLPGFSSGTFLAK